MSQEAMDAGVDVKVESDDEVEPYDGSYACGFCSESVRGTAALKCSQCSSNPVHWACVAGTKYAGQCATCDGNTIAAWRGAGGLTAAASEIIDLRDLEGGGQGATEVATLARNWAREEDTVPGVGNGIVAADMARWDARGEQADAASGSSGKGKEPAWADAGREAEGEGAATSENAGAGVGGGGKGKGRADNDRERGSRGRSGGESSAGGHGAGRSGGSGGRRAEDEQRGEGSRKRAAPDGDEGSSRGG